MKNYEIHVTAFHKYLFERDYIIRASNEAVATARAIKEFWRDPTNKRRKRKTLWIKVIIKL